LDFGFRSYDPRIGRWWRVDPMTPFASNWTPYRFGLDNPIRYSDKDGDFETDQVDEKIRPKEQAALNNILIYLQKSESAASHKQISPANRTIKWRKIYTYIIKKIVFGLLFNFIALR
jgi:hypothetical protein